MRRSLFTRAATMIFACILVLTSFASAYAFPVTENTTLLLAEGKLSATTFQPLQEEIENYFSARAEMVPAQASVSDSVTPMLVEETSARMQSLKTFWQEQDIYVISAENSAMILNAQQKTSGDINLSIYEWTWLDYNNGDGANAPATDRMGFATIHEVTARETNGRFTIVADIYDESDITGYTSEGYSVVAETALLAESGNTTSCDEVYLDGLYLNDDYMDSPSACVTYADTYVIHSIAGEAGVSYSQYYNTDVYGYADGNDCCNYVSQCLKAGGFVFDPTRAANRDKTKAGQWWHSQTGNLSDSSESWRLVSKFITYWKNRYGIEDITSNASNLCAGTPVITNNEGHIAICVGTNSSGKPIINGHTRDVYHQPVTGKSSSSGGYGKIIPLVENT